MSWGVLPSENRVSSGQWQQVGRGDAHWTPNLRALKRLGRLSTSCCLTGALLTAGAMAPVFRVAAVGNWERQRGLVVARWTDAPRCRETLPAHSRQGVKFGWPKARALGCRFSVADRTRRFEGDAERKHVDRLFLVEETQMSASKYFAIDSPRRGGAQMAKTGNDSKKASRAPPKHSALQPGRSWRPVSGQKRYFARGLGDFHLACIAHRDPPLAVSYTLERYPFLMDKGSFCQSCAPAEAHSVIASSACLGLSWSRLTEASRSHSLRPRVKASDSS